MPPVNMACCLCGVGLCSGCLPPPRPYTHAFARSQAPVIVQLFAKLAVIPAGTANFDILLGPFLMYFAARHRPPHPTRSRVMDTKRKTQKTTNPTVSRSYL